MPEEGPRGLPEHVTLPLLTLVTRTSLDEDYAYVAQRRGSQGDPARHTRGSWLSVGAVVAAFGLLVSVAAVQTSQHAEIDAGSRTALLAQIDERRAEAARLQVRLGRLRAQTTQLDGSVSELESTLQTTLTRAQRMRLGTGYAAVRGPGLRITIEDAPSGIPQEAVQARDLALLVNALWGAGAEAIAINNRRLTPLTAVRNSSLAINVGAQSITPPYVVEAIGDPEALPRDFVNSFQGQRFFALADAVGFPVDTATVGTLRLPAAAPPRLLHVGAESGVDSAVDNGEGPEGGVS